MSESSPRRSWVPRGRALVVLIAVACVVVYAVVVGLYALNDRTIRGDSCTSGQQADRILLSIAPQSVDAIGNRMTATVDVVDFGPMGEGAVPDETMTMVLIGTDGPRTYNFDADTVASPISVRFITEGDAEAWPFDAHTAGFGVLMLRDAAGDAPEVLRPDVCGVVHVPGWSFSAYEVDDGGELVVDGDSVAVGRIVAVRSAATIAFGILLLVLMTTLPVLGIAVAVSVLRGRRKAEASLTSWMAAMLFAIVPLRGFLPGSPPIGSWVDYLVVLWVVAGLVAGLVVYVIAWLRWAPPGERGR